MSSELATTRDYEPREIIDAAMVVASWFVVGSAMYMRGRLDGSGMSPAAFSEHAAAHGPIWPAAVFGLGMAVLLGGFITLWRNTDA